MINRYSGEIHINPIAILRNDDFNNDGVIGDINQLLDEAIALQNQITDRTTRLKAYLKSAKPSGTPQFRFAEGGYIAVTGLSDQELMTMKSKGLIELYDNANDRSWVMKHGSQFGLIWEKGRAVEIS